MSATYERAQAFVALARVDRDRLDQAVSPLLEAYSIEAVSAPSAGLAMMRIKESVNGDPFNIGEIPLSVATVRIHVEGKEDVLGASQIMADDAELATTLAICDAALSHQLPGADQIWDLLEEGLREIGTDRDVRQSILNRSRVRFALLNEEQA